jgi:ribA/ribD-fused uncharacterized protein
MQVPAFRGDRFFLSNFYPCSVKYEGRIFRSSEHAYAWEKVGRRRDLDLTVSAAQIKRDARFLGVRLGWYDDRVAIMKAILEAKFSDPDLKRRLKSTGDERLVERNLWHDNFWGSCCCSRCGDRGENWLGKLLMEIRDV